ncbi:uncharacterized protein [Paramormyrops kingsleyae]|uniref:uncharacterized protein n=1 Tax=Paramormyrops kingsleyae TaxID=1676925 RepID=UPI003B96F24C
MAGDAVKRWVISEDGSHLIRREEVEEELVKDVEDQPHKLMVKEETSDHPVTSLLSASTCKAPSCSANKKYDVPSDLPVSYPCSYCDICFTASHYLEKHFKRSHRKQYLELLHGQGISTKKPPPSPAGLSGLPSSHKVPVSSPGHFLGHSGCHSQVVDPDGSACSKTSLTTSDELIDNRPQTPPASNSGSSLIPSHCCSKTITKTIPSQVTPPDIAQSSGTQAGRKETERNATPSGIHYRDAEEGEQRGDVGEELSHEEGSSVLCDCGQSFPSLESLSHHQDRTHRIKVEETTEGEEGETLYLCTECGLSFPCLDRLRQHQSLHDSLGHAVRNEENEEDGKEDADSPRSLAFRQSHSCPSCHKTFKTARYLKTHMKIHSGQVPYHCDQCDKPFTQLGDLKTHQRTHTGERPYQCSQCGKCFGRSGTLKKHWRTHTGETPYVCTMCGKQFNQLGALKTHERIHTGLRPYFCSLCLQHFTYSYQLKRHRCVRKETLD